MELTSVKELYRNRDSYTDKKVTVGGWVRGNRDSKSFLHGKLVQRYKCF